jgi:osmotically inducible lipoprotein OsmB
LSARSGFYVTPIHHTEKGKKKMKTITRTIAAASLALLAACGYQEGDRIATGAGTGAATGAVIGAIAGPIGVGAGAAIGAGVGAATGGVTSPQVVNLGTPIWEAKG